MSYQTPPPSQTSTMALISLIAGITGWTIFPVLGSIVAVITGHMAKNEIRNSSGMLTGDGFATAGLILGYLSLALGVLGICLAIAVLGFGLTLPLCFIPFASETGAIIELLKLF